MLKPRRYPGGGRIERFPFHWNMQRDESITVRHTLDLNAIRFIGDRPVEITITDDSEKEFTGLGIGGGGYTIQPRAFELWRPNYGEFAGPKYKSDEVVRGFIVVLYKHK